jgi:hypothetical protein
MSTFSFCFRRAIERVCEGPEGADTAVSIRTGIYISVIGPEGRGQLSTGGFLSFPRNYEFLFTTHNLRTRPNFF